jgi:hypothetical protein
MNRRKTNGGEIVISPLAQPNVAIQDSNTFLKLAVRNADHFQYKVVFGSPDEVAAEICTRSNNNA